MFVPWWVVLGSGISVIFTLTVLTIYARRQAEKQETHAGDGSAKSESDQVLEQVDALMSQSKDIEQVPQVDDVLKSMAEDNQRRHLEELMRRWVDVAQRYSDAALVLRKEIHFVIQQTEQAVNTIASSFQAVINKATIQARQAMELLEGTQGATSDGSPQSLKDFIPLSAGRSNKIAVEAGRVPDLSVNVGD